MTRLRRLGAFALSWWYVAFITLFSMSSGNPWVVLLVMTAAWQYRERERRRAGRAVDRPPMNLPRRTADEPFRGYKYALPVMNRGRMVFRPMFNPGTYGVEADASCTLLQYATTNWPGRKVTTIVGDRPHIAIPDPGCTCGFYAWSRRPWTVAMRRRDAVNRWRMRRKNEVLPSAAVLDVEMLGTVVVCSRGYRASRQRVMRVLMDQRCACCRRLAVGFYAGTFVSNGHAVIVSTCGRRMPVTATIEDLRNRCGTEVVWDEMRKPLLTRWTARG